jgi:septal ring factor EnvC (AmiA/AmiB activator)
LPPFSLARRWLARSHALPKKSAESVASPDIAEKQADLGSLRSRIDGLRKELSSSEESKADAGDRLREADRLISLMEREQRALNDSAVNWKKLKNLEQQSQELSATLGQQQTQLEKLIYKQYLRGTPDSLQLLLNGNDPNEMARDLHYFSAIALTRADMMGEINANLAKKNPSRPMPRNAAQSSPQSRRSNKNAMPNCKSNGKNVRSCTPKFPAR